jgi:MoaA/NifB/PqqE/SkfB family radical SAM enzyme
VSASPPVPSSAPIDGAVEQALMRRVRSGVLAPADLARLLPPFPLKIQIQTASPCNAACVMCPWPDTAARLPQGTMSDATFARVVEDLVGRGVERTSLFLMNEPLVDRRLAQRTRLLKTRVPETRALIFTNGALLDGERARELVDAGMDEITVSVVGFDRESYESLMKNIDHERVMRNLAEIGALLARGALGRLVFRVVGLDFPEARRGLEEFRTRTGIEPELKPVTNRAGSVDVERFVPGRVASAFRACQRPFVKTYVLYDGSVVLCNCDWERTTVLGNVNELRLHEIWRGPALEAIRAWHLAGELPAGSLCSRCDYPHLGEASD